MKSIVVGVDRSDTARKAAETAAALAASLDADQFLSELARQLPNAAITTSVGQGDPAKAICDEAERLDARLIVIGNKRVQGLARVLGSVAGDVMKHAHCDVYVANTRADH